MPKPLFSDEVRYLAVQSNTNDFYMKDHTHSTNSEIENDTEIIFQIKKRDPNATKQIPTNSRIQTAV